MIILQTLVEHSDLFINILLIELLIIIGLGIIESIGEAGD